MNPKPLTEAKDQDVRHAFVALQRARQIAAQTQTAVVVMRDSMIIYELPEGENTLRLSTHCQP